MGTQQFCLRWNNHQVNMLNVFESLLQNEVLVDVTLACDGLTLKAHKVVLSACSPYFQSLFMDNPCKHPIVFLKDVRYCDLKALIDFMYKGEVNVGQDQLNALLNTAESLKIKGLAEVTGGVGGSGGVSCMNATLEPHVPPHLIGRLQQAGTNNNNSTSVGMASAAAAAAAAANTAPTSPSTLPVSSGSLAQHSPGLGDSSKAPAGGGGGGSGNALPLLQPLPNSSSSSSKRFGISSSSSSSPPPKRRKTKPRKRIPESTIISSDQEDSDALDLATTTPEMIETCVDLPPTDNVTDAAPSSETKCSTEETKITAAAFPGIEITNQSHHQSYQYEVVGEENPNLDNKPFSSTNQNQYPPAVTSAIASTQRLGSLLPKPPLLSVLPPASLSPAPSTSATEATIQDIRRMCHFTRQSQKHKSPWTEDDMVSALEAVQCGRLTYALAARKFDIPKATLHYYVILMKAVEAVRSGRMTPEIAAIKYNVRASILIGCLYGGSSEQSRNSSPPPTPSSASSQPMMLTERNDVTRKEQ